MSKGRRVGLLLGIVAALLVVGAVALFGVGVGAYLLLGDGAPGLSDENDSLAGMVALGEGRAIFLYGHGISEPMLVRGVRVEGGALTATFNHRVIAGYATNPSRWRRAGDIAAGELHPTDGQGPRRVECFHHERGSLGAVPDVVEGAWLLSEDGSELLAFTGDALVLHRTAPFVEVWRAPIAEPGRFLARLALTPSFAIVYDGTVHVVRRGDGGVVRTVDGHELSGVDRAREEMLLLRDGRLVVESLETGAERLVIDLADGASVVDGMEEPALLGTHAGRWIVVYATELDHSFTSNTEPTWVRYAPRWLAAVDPESGAIVWRAELARWPRWTSMWNQVIDDERELGAELVWYSDAAAENGVVVGHLARVSLADGAMGGELDYPHATRSNALFASYGDVTYLRVREPGEGSRSALARFDRGRLTSAIWLPRFGGDVREPMLREDEAWIPTGSESWALVGADLRVRARGGPAEPPSDARAWVAERLGL